MRGPHAMLGTDSTSRGELPYFIFELQYRHLQRADTGAQSLIYGVTLSAALGGSLLVAAAGGSHLEVVFGLLLLAYLFSVGNAVRYALRVLYSGESNALAGKSWIHFAHVAEFDSFHEFAEFVNGCDEEEQRAEILQYAYLMATVVTWKVEAMRLAVRWTHVSLLGLIGLIIIRFGESFVLTHPLPFS